MKKVILSSLILLGAALNVNAQNFFTFKFVNMTGEGLNHVIAYPEGFPKMATDLCPSQLKNNHSLSSVIDVGANENPPCLFHIVIPNPVDNGASGIEFSNINFCDMNELHLIDDGNGGLTYIIK